MQYRLMKSAGTEILPMPTVSEKGASDVQIFMFEVYEVRIDVCANAE